MKRKSLLFVLIVMVIIAFVLFSCGKQNASTDTGKKIKAGFIYVGPVGDYGWSNAHDVGRLYVDKKYDWLETVYVESVSEGDCARVIDRLILEEKCDIVFTTSFGYMDATIAAGKKYPDKIFMHCSGIKQSENVGSYFAELYQMYYLNGLMAGALTKSNNLGYVGAHPIPEVVRHINAYALGAKTVNPKATVSVKWIYAWYDPAKAREAAEALVSEGVDALAFTEDSPSVIEVGQDKTSKGTPVYTFSHYSPMQRFGKDSVVSGQLVDWGVMYYDILTKVYNGNWTNQDMWWLAREKAALLGGELDQPINEKYVSQLKSIKVVVKDLGTLSVYDLVMKRLAQFTSQEIGFEPFTGPIKNQQGAVIIKDGEKASFDVLISFNWFVENVIGFIK